jgi:hypothetical protein
MARQPRATTADPVPANPAQQEHVANLRPQAGGTREPVICAAGHGNPSDCAPHSYSAIRRIAAQAQRHFL